MITYYTDRDFGDEYNYDCSFQPELVFSPIGMFHCPECGQMQIAGLPHLTDEDYLLDGLVFIYDHD